MSPCHTAGWLSSICVEAAYRGFMKLATVLSKESEVQAVQHLVCYYSDDKTHTYYTGSRWDLWDPAKTHAYNADVFTADDVVACSFLSAPIGSLAAIELLKDRREELTRLLKAIGTDRDLVDVENPLADDGPEYTLLSALRSLPDVGPTRASKLLARKRPLLRPIYDTIVAAELEENRFFWERLRQLLRQDDRALYRHLLRLQEVAAQEIGTIRSISPLRVLDVAVWMEGQRRRGRACKHYGSSASQVDR